MSLSYLLGGFGMDILEQLFEYVHTETTDRPPRGYVKQVLYKTGTASF